MRFWRYIKDILNDENLEDLFDLNDENALDNTDNPEDNSSNESGEQSDNNDGSESNSSNESGNQSDSSDGSESNSSNESGDQSDSNDGSENSSSNEPGNKSDNSESLESSSSNETGNQSSSRNSSDSSPSSKPGKQSDNNDNLQKSSSNEDENQSNDINRNSNLSNKNTKLSKNSKNNQSSNLSNNNSNFDSSKSDNDTKDKQKQPSKDLGEKNTKDNLSNDKNNNLDKNSNENNSCDKLTNEQKLELYKKLKESIKEIQERKKRKLEKSKLHGEKEKAEKSEEEKYELSEQANNFLNQLGELPPFGDRDRGAGYSIDTLSTTEIPESIVRTLITKFLNQRFCKKNTDLNIRSNSLEKTNGFHKWEVKDVIVHLETHQVTKVLTDKYGYQYADGNNENVPLSFYFDMSGSMSNYTNMLAVIAIELLKKDVKVLIGFNERVNVQIEKIEKNISVEELSQILESAGYNGSWTTQSDFKKDKRVTFKYIDRDIDNYLIEKKCEKCVVFSDFDPIDEVINLSHAADVYWFCFEDNRNRDHLKKFNGFLYKVKNVYDLEQGLIKVNQKRFETLVYTENPKNLQKKIGVRK